MTTVLVTSAGSNPAISVVRTLRATLEGVRLLGTDINPRSLCAGAALVDSFHRVPPASDADAYLDALAALVREEGVDVVIPIHDFEVGVLSRCRERLGAGVFVAAARAEVVETCNDKLLTARAAERLGIPVPRLFAPEEVGAGDLPVIVKERRGLGSRAMRVVREPGALAPETIDPAHLLVQEFVAGVEYTVDCYSDREGKLFQSVVRSRLEVRDGICTKGEVVRLPEIDELCRALLDGIGFQGASNVQFMVRGGTPYLIEINPRFSSTVVFAVAAGMNSPLYTVLEAAGRPLPAPPPLRYGLRMARYWMESFHDAE